MGKLPPDRENPVPEVAAALIVAAMVPLEVTVTEFVTAVPTETLPNESEAALKLRVADAAFSCRESAFEVVPIVAVRIADCVLATEATFAVKVALVAPAGMVTELGTATALALLPRLTLRPPVGAGPDRLTVHESVSDPVMEVLLQETPVTVGITVAPVPLRLTACVAALLDMVNCPVTELAVVGSN
jgi:hypothetical protein